MMSIRRRSFVDVVPAPPSATLARHLGHDEKMMMRR